MSSVLQTKPVAQDNLAEKLNFQQKLQAVTNKIHATKYVDEIILELSQDWCNLFGADRLTIYQVNEDKTSIISKVKTGLNSFKDIKLPISEQSIAGCEAPTLIVYNACDHVVVIDGTATADGQDVEIEPLALVDVLVRVDLGEAIGPGLMQFVVPALVGGAAVAVVFVLVEEDRRPGGDDDDDD